MDFPPALYRLFWALLGLLVGSFLNVAIHRYPLQGESVGHPRRSRCPNCRTTLSWRENIPLVSWVLQRGRCRHCNCRISWRYPLVEALTASLFLLVAWRGGPQNWALDGTFNLVLAGLIVATFVDFDCFEIPDQVSIGGMIFAPLISILLPALHQDSPIAHWLSDGSAPSSVDRFGALMTSLAGLLVGGGVLWGIAWLGQRILGKEAMGLGDVKLLAAGGGLVGPGGALVALVLASFLASIVGVANIARVFCFLRRRARVRGRSSPSGKTYRVAHAWGSLLPFGPYLALGIGFALLYWNDMPL